MNRHVGWEDKELLGMDQYEMVRTAHRVYKKSIRRISRETGHTREKEPACPVMDRAVLGHDPRDFADVPLCSIRI